MGGEFMNEWRTVRLDDEALERLAAGTNLDGLARGKSEEAGESSSGVLTGDAESTL
jgi:hypothetical protein